MTFKPRTLRQGVDDLFGQAVAEILVLLVGAEIGEGQHGDGWLQFWAGLLVSNILKGLLSSRHALKSLPGCFARHGNDFTAAGDSMGAGSSPPRSAHPPSPRRRRLAASSISYSTAPKLKMSEVRRAVCPAPVPETYRRRAEHSARRGLRRRVVAGRVIWRGRSQQFRADSRNHDIGRLQIAMQNPLLCAASSAPAIWGAIRGSSSRRQRAAERFAVDILHHQIIVTYVVEIWQMWGWFSAAIARASCWNRAPWPS